MVLGVFDGSMVNLAFMNTCPPKVVVVSSPLQTRFICSRISAGIGWPSAEPDTIDHSPCNRARAFVTALFSPAPADEMVVTAANPTRNKLWIIFIVVSDYCDVLPAYSLGKKRRG